MQKIDTGSVEASCESSSIDVAIIGMSCRFPDADTPEKFWNNLINDLESIQRFSKDELKTEGITDELLDNPDYVFAKGLINGIEWFDANFFGYNPYDARITDPQQKLFLESAWEALEVSGYSPEKYPGTIGVYASMADSTYLQNNLLKNTEVLKDLDWLEARIATSISTLGAQLSYRLNLTGPSINMATACSSSLVVVATACRSLIDYECDIAIAGAVALSLPKKRGYLFKEDGIESPDGHCRSFDANAKGTVFSDGLGIVILKRLQDAIDDNDTIHAVIKGWNINNDGANKAGFTAPSVNGQANCAASALALSNISPESISYVEAHGTATMIGDVIELSALTKAFNTQTEKKQFCPIGSVKSNLGHLDIAAGMASLLKTTLSLKHKFIPATLHFEKPNPSIDFQNTPFYVNNTLQKWENCSLPRRAGINSSGIGGTNAFLVLEEFTPIKKESVTSPYHLFTLSAKTKTALDKMTQNLIQDIEKINTTAELADIAYTLQVGRSDFNYRRIFVCKDIQDTLSLLKNLPKERVFTNKHVISSQPKVVFMFSGQGSQYIGMAKGLYDSEPEFAKLVDHCAKLDPLIKRAVDEIILYPSENIEHNNHTLIIQPALFVLEYSMAKLLIGFGIKPDAMIGHSLGEYVAACLSGLMSLPDAMKLVCARAKLMATTAHGAMMAVELPEDKLEYYLMQKNLSIAAVNSPNSCVVSGDIEEILELEKIFKKNNIGTKILKTSHAFHSTLMDPILDEYRKVLENIKFNVPTMPFISNVTGDWIDYREINKPEYWLKHLRGTVRFLQGMETLTYEKYNVFIEIGPGKTLTNLARELIKKSSEICIQNILPSIKADMTDQACLLNTLGQLWLHGASIDWKMLYRNQERYRLPLSTYPFERNKYWISPENTANHIVSNNKQPYEKWFYESSWIRSTLLYLDQIEEKNFAKPFSWLIFLDALGVGETIANILLQHKQLVIKIRPGKEFSQIHANEYSIDITRKEHYQNLVKRLMKSSDLPFNVMSLFSLTEEHHIDNFDLDEVRKTTDLSFYHLLFFTQALIEQQYDNEINILNISNETYPVIGYENIYPAKALITGPCRVIPQEHANFKIRILDLLLSELANSDKKIMICHQIILDMLAEQNESKENIIAYRGEFRWTQVFQAIKLKHDSAINTKQNATYLFTGGLGGISLTIAKHLASASKNPRFILVSRSSLPSKEDWNVWIKNHDINDAISKKINKLLEIENLGAEVILRCADISNYGECEILIKEIKKNFGTINGIIHAAGIPGGGLVQYKNTSMVEKVFLPKVTGTYILTHLLRDEKLDFFLLCSSGSAIIGEPSQVDYCAANACLDAFVFSKVLKQVNLFATINWNTWREVGMAIETDRPQNISFFDRNNDISPREGARIFSDVLNNKFKQVIVSTYDISFFIDSVTNIHNNPSLTLEKPLEILESDDNYLAPTNDVELELSHLWQNVLGFHRISIDDDFSALGGHSLMALRLLTLIGKKFNVKLSLQTLQECKTIQNQAKKILHLKENKKEISSILVPIRNEGDCTPLFCFHPVGGTIFCYLELAKHLKFNCPIYGLQDPSLNDGKLLFKSLEEMAQCYLHAIQKVQKKGPYVLAGLSFGATLAVEVAKQLYEKGEEVSRLIFFDGWSKFADDQHIETNFINAILSRIKTTAAINESFAELAWQRMNLLLNYNFPIIKAPITLFKAKNLLPEYIEINQAYNYWDYYSNDKIDVYNIPGDHETILDLPFVKRIAKILDDIFMRVESTIS